MNELNILKFYNKIKENFKRNARVIYSLLKIQNFINKLIYL
jgi:hypothetical protein